VGGWSDIVGGGLVGGVYSGVSVTVSRKSHLVWGEKN